MGVARTGGYWHSDTAFLAHPVPLTLLYPQLVPRQTRRTTMFIDLGLRLGFGGAMTFERALQIRRLAADIPDTAFVLETDAPDIPPQWLYKTAEQRRAGESARNEPAELPRIARTLAELRRLPVEAVERLSTANASAALPRLAEVAPQ